MDAGDKMMTEDQILHQAGPYWVCKAKHGYEVYKDGVTHATRCAIIGFEGQKGLTRAKAEADRRNQQERTQNARQQSNG